MNKFCSLLCVRLLIVSCYVFSTRLPGLVKTLLSKLKKDGMWITLIVRWFAILLIYPRMSDLSPEYIQEFNIVVFILRQDLALQCDRKSLLEKYRSLLQEVQLCQRGDYCKWNCSLKKKQKHQHLLLLLLLSLFSVSFVCVLCGAVNGHACVVRLLGVSLELVISITVVLCG